MEEDITLGFGGEGYPPTTSPQENAVTYKRNGGFVMVTDIGHQAIASALRFDPTVLTENTQWFIDHGSQAEIRPSAASLYIVSQNLSYQAREHLGPGYLMKRYGVKQEEKAWNINKFLFQKGFGDMDFTWHFAPAVANAMCASFVRNGLLTQEQHDNLTLGDWADMIGSYWFSDVMHDMALTRNGVYGGLGSQYEHYNDVNFVEQLRSRLAHPANGKWQEIAENEVFVPALRYDPDEDVTYLTATLHKDIRKRLREMMHESRESVGCPVARRAGTLVLDVVNQKRLQDLVDRRELETAEEKDGKVRYHQEYTPIDRALDVLALKLEEFERRRGTLDPQVYLSAQKRVFVERPKTNALILPGNRSVQADAMLA